MSATDTIQVRNRVFASMINKEALRNPQSPYANQFAGIASGQVVVLADELDRRLRQIEPTPSKTFCVEASRDHSLVEEIWGLR